VCKGCLSNPTVFRRTGFAGHHPLPAQHDALREGPSSVSFIFPMRTRCSGCCKHAVCVHQRVRSNFQLPSLKLKLREKGNEEARDVALFSYIGCQSRKHDLLLPRSCCPLSAPTITHSCFQGACQGIFFPICSCQLYGKMDL
jgi:hypothetical protein